MKSVTVPCGSTVTCTEILAQGGGTCAIATAANVRITRKTFIYLLYEIFPSAASISSSKFRRLAFRFSLPMFGEFT
jgi:hypothetical protein